jgi:hypothetical protein
MCSLGLCRTDDTAVGIVRKFAPLVIPGFSQPDRADAMRVVAAGLPEVDWSDDLSDEENVAIVRAHFEEVGMPPAEALADIRDWMQEDVGSDRPIIVGSPVTFDFMWIYWYWWYLLDEMPLFGFSGLDVRSYFMGSHGVGFMGTGKERYLKHYPNEFAHTHDPLEDARQQGRIWRDMVAARRARDED